MKKIIAAAGAFALAACGGSDVDEPTEAEMGDAPVVAEAPAATTGAAGTYTMEDGATTMQISLGADGSYSQMQNGAVTESGTWSEGPNGPCLTATGENENCFTRTVGADGTVTMVTADGQSSTWQYQP